MADRRERLLAERIGLALREQRLALGMTMADVAERLGVSYQQVQKYEKARNHLNLLRAARLRRAFDISLDEIIDDALDGERVRHFAASPDADHLLRMMRRMGRRELRLLRKLAEAVIEGTEER